MNFLQSKITKVGLLIMLLFFIYSCGESKKGWSQDEKDKFVAGCVKSNKGAVSDEKAKEFCTCMLDRMVEKYPTMAESQTMDVEEMREIALACKE